MFQRRMAIFKAGCTAVVAAVVAVSCVHKVPVVEQARLADPEPEMAAGGPVASAVDSAKEQVPQKEAGELQHEETVSPPATNSVVAVKALSVEDIEFYLKNKVSSKLIAQRIMARGVSFELNNKTRIRLKKAKADSRVFKAITEASVKPQK